MDKILSKNTQLKWQSQLAAPADRQIWEIYMTDLDCPEGAVAMGQGLPTVLVAALALIDVDGRVLIARRPEGKSMAGLWEFPGGKVEVGELPEEALIREAKEELNIDITASCLSPFAFASHSYEKFHLLMPLYLCRKWDGLVQGMENQATKWVKISDLRHYPMPPADDPLVAMLRDFF